MIKKITNWTFGSIFRTIGRFLAYIIIGVIISLLFIKKDYVKALTYTTEVQVKSSSYFDIRNASSFTCNTWDSCEWELVSSDSNPINSKQIQINSNYNTKNKDFIAFQILLSQPVQITNVQQGIQMYCTNWTQNGTSYYCSNVSPATNGTPIIQESILSDINFNIKANYTNNTSAFCDINGNQIICPTFKNQIDNVEITWNFKTHYTSYALFRFYKIANNIYYSNPTSAIENQTQQQQQQHNETIQTITGEVNGTGENGTVTDADAMQNSCGLICKLKHLIKMLSIDNIKYLVVPTEEQMNDLFEQMQNKITSKLGILGLPVTVYTRLMQIAMQYDDSQQNWCLTWDNVAVPNFEDFNIIQGGQWCFSDILQNQKISAFRTVCMSIIGGLILLSFIQYLYNCLHRILDVPIQENYEYITTEDVINYDTFTGEVNGRQHRTRTTKKVEVDN